MQQHREDMQQMIKDLLANGAAAQGGSQGMSMTGMPSFSATGLGGTSRGVAPPQPIFNNDGRITEGFSHRLNTKLKVTGVKGEPTGMQEKDLYDNAFLQLQLQECFQVIAKKDEMLKSQHREIKNLWERVKKNLRMQDMLYRDFHHRETERQRSTERTCDCDWLLLEGRELQVRSEVGKASRAVHALGARHVPLLQHQAGLRLRAASYEVSEWTATL